MVEIPFDLRHSDEGMKLRLLSRNAGERWSVVSAEIDCGSLEASHTVCFVLQYVVNGFTETEGETC